MYNICLHMLIHIPMHFLFWVFNETSMKRYRDIAELANGRELKDGKIVKYFQFPTFMKAMDIVNSIAMIADTVNHHPVITINWRTVKLSLKSSDVDAITKRDINLAKEIEKASA